MTKDSDGGAADRDRARQLILKRRSIFIASALVGLTASGCEDVKEPQVCLSIAVPEPTTSGSSDAGADNPNAGSGGAKPAAPPTAASSSSDQDAGSPPVDAGPAPNPAPTLNPAPTPTPRVCLKMRMPPVDRKNGAG